MARITLTWVGGEHDFALYIGNLRAVQKHCDAGPEQIYNRIADGEWRVDDLFEVVRQGLIGAGMPTGEASELATRTFNQHPWISFKMTALAILAAALSGVEDDSPGEEQGEASAPENGASPNFTEPGQ